jgi:hypothetical protein
VNALEQILQRNGPESVSFCRPGFAGSISGGGSILTQYGLFDTSVIAPGRSNPAMEDARTFGKAVVYGDEA